MKINEIILYLESLAHPSLQENYDNAGLITGDPGWECSGIICSLDATDEVMTEAVAKKCNLVVAHHPIIFGGLKKINGKNYVEKTIITAIKNDIAIYAIHTNIDNVIEGVSGKMANMLGLKNISILSPKENTLKKLFTFAPVDKAEEVRNAIFAAGGGHIGNYSECSFNAEGIGTFKAGEGTNPYVGEIGRQHQEKEIKIGVIFPSFLEKRIVAAMKAVHPYEEVAYEVISLSNSDQSIGSGVIGEWPESINEKQFLRKVKEVFNTPLIRHTALLNKAIKRVALCGGAGSFLTSKALAAGADAYITSDIKYHEFFDANKRMILADIGHYESEQFTIDLLKEGLEEKFPTFAVLKTEVKTNPVNYFL
ncbi:MAG TPA: Nif3-like dinuclear metal center hexameric protein [Chitinophagaceae bacterium]|nr:Nif3-like dinuclear metal center hexameric protein [Chitinophagaceae bacterium]